MVIIRKKKHVQSVGLPTIHGGLNSDLSMENCTNKGGSRHDDLVGTGITPAHDHIWKKYMSYESQHEYPKMSEKSGNEATTLVQFYYGL